MDITPSREYLVDLADRLATLLGPDEAANILVDRPAIMTIAMAMRMMTDIWRPLPDDAPRGRGDLTPTRRYLEDLTAKIEGFFNGEAAVPMLSSGETFVALKALRNATDIWRPEEREAAQ
jgi:hypothetical protein